MTDNPTTTGDKYERCICLIGDEINPKCPSHNPTTTGEWTVERLREYLGGYSSYDLQLKAIADAHNAEITAERDKRSYSRLHVDLAESRRDNEQLREQLAAMELELQRSNAKVAEKAAQLAAAQAAIKQLLLAIPNDERLAVHVELFESLLDAAIAAAQQPLQQKIQELEAKLSKYES